MIPIIDSGVGGLTVLLPLMEAIPCEDLFYIADHRFCPYGNRTQEALRQRLKDLIAHTLDLPKPSSAILIACNTATTIAIDHLRQQFDLPFIGTEPAIRPAALQSKTKHIAVLATDVTLKSTLFQTTAKKHANGCTIHPLTATELVPIVEEQRYDDPETIRTIERLLEPLHLYPIDHIVLGCTHFPFLTPQIERLVPKRVTIVNPAPAIAKQTKWVLEEANSRSSRIRNPNLPSVKKEDQRSITLCSTGTTEQAQRLIKQLIRYATICGTAVDLTHLSAENINL